MSEESRWLLANMNPAMLNTKFDDELCRYICANCGGRGNLYQSGHLDGNKWLCPKWERDTPVGAAPEPSR